MANYLIGLDFGTSQTKVCLLNKDSDIREFIKFNNEKYFLPSLITQKDDDTFSYGDENSEGLKYRYFKMAAAEDEDIIRTTNEDLQGNLNGVINDYKKYSTAFEINPEILVVLYLAYIYLYIKEKKDNQNEVPMGGLLGRLAGKSNNKENSFAVNLGIPTEWHNPNHIKRKVKFQSLLLTAIELANQFNSLNDFVSAKKDYLLNLISQINQSHLSKLDNRDVDEKAKIIQNLLQDYKLSVFPESAAGIIYLLSTERLDDGAYATLDIGAGTSDIAIFSVTDNQLHTYYSSESAELAANDVYRKYAELEFQEDFFKTPFETIKQVEDIITNHKLNIETYNDAITSVRGDLTQNSIEYIIRKTFYKYYQHQHQQNRTLAANVLGQLDEQPILVFGGGANLPSFDTGVYCYFRGINPFGADNRYFEARRITKYVQQVDIANAEEAQNYINLLILALGLTYSEQNGNYIPFVVPVTDFQMEIVQNPFDRYFYYDLQDAVYK